MRLFFVLLFLFIGAKPSFAQDAIRGFVVDSATNKPIEGAAVFYENTMLGTSTNKNGFFVLRAEEEIKSLINIRALGYKQVRLESPKINQNQRFLLAQTDTELEAVYINAKNKPTTNQHTKTRKNSNRLTEHFSYYFKHLFLGKQYKDEVNIENLDKLQLKYSANNKDIIISGEYPLLLENEYLGYKITYFLDQFTLKRKESELTTNLVNDSYQLLGTALFEELNPKKIKNKYKRRRNAVYEHSILRLMRALTDSTLAEEGFKLVNEKGEAISINRIKKDNFTEIKPPPIFYIYRPEDVKNHDEKTWKQVQFELKKEPNPRITKVIAKQNFGIDRLGNFFPHTALRFEGYLGKRGYATALPLDFEPYE